MQSHIISELYHLRYNRVDQNKTIADRKWNVHVCWVGHGVSSDLSRYHSGSLG